MTPDKLFETLSKYAAGMGMELNSDRPHVMTLMQGLLTNEGRYGYRSCPCRLALGTRDADLDIVCPCAYRDEDVAEFGSCYCGLYVTPDWNAGCTAKTIVPERRPLDKRFPPGP